MTEEMISAVTTGLTQVQTDYMSIVGVALPIGLAIFGVGLAVRYGVKFFKSISK